MYTPENGVAGTIKPVVGDGALVDVVGDGAPVAVVGDGAAVAVVGDGAAVVVIGDGAAVVIGAEVGTISDDWDGAGVLAFLAFLTFFSFLDFPCFFALDLEAFVDFRSKIFALRIIIPFPLSFDVLSKIFELFADIPFPLCLGSLLVIRWVEASAVVTRRRMNANALWI
jgi:hypothetical protein